MKYSRKLHGALILAAFAVLFAVIGSAYCQMSTKMDTVKTDTVPSSVWRTMEMDSIGGSSIGTSITYPPHIITFVDSLGFAVLVLHPNGDIFWRGRLVTTDSMLVQGLRDIIEGFSMIQKIKQRRE